jgi:flagellar operon protein
VIDKNLGIGNAIGNTSPISPNLPNKPDKNLPSGFDNLLDDVIKNQPGQQVKPASVDVTAVSPPFGAKTVPVGLKFSQHALDRMNSRGITFKPEDLARLNDAVDKAAKKGSKETLLLMGDNALIVSVKNKTVVTTMDREAMKENVFTNIDSTVIL